MKSKEKEAFEYVGMINSYSTIQYHRSRDFLAGVNFAEQWISVDDELPEKLEEKCVSERVLIKMENIITCGYYDYECKTWVPDFGSGKVISWRPINRK